MPEDVLFVTESTADRTAVADYLRTVADRLETGGPLSLASGDQSVTLDVPRTVEFEVKAERETGDGTPEVSVEFELEWDDGTTESDGSLEIS